MRWVFVLALMINAIYYLYERSVANPEKAINGGVVATRDLGQPVLLLTERPELSRLAEEKKPIEVVEKKLPLCWMLGPFTEQISAKQVLGRLEGLDIYFRLKAVEVQGKPDYWVYIPPYLSRKLAMSALTELQIKKIDSFLISSGEFENGISLGLFSSKDRAEKLLEKRKAQDLAAKMAEKPRLYTEYWLISQEGEYEKFSEKLWQKIHASHQELERRKNFCNRLASLENIE